MVTKTKKYVKKPPPPKHCIVCGNEYGDHKCQPSCHCQICKLPFEEHPYCSRCGILIGAKHDEKSIGQIIDGKIVCDTCLQWFRGTKGVRDDD